MDLGRHEDPNAERLLKTPLHVLLLTFILERLGALPADGYHLFWRYYETIYDREAAKATSLRSPFAQHRGYITELHEPVGLLLQMQAETLGEAKSRMPLSILRTLATERMMKVRHDANNEAKKIAQRIVDAATHRLVLLVPSEEDTVSFEVRSLQELMAARAISSGSDEEVRSGLRFKAPSQHWRNTWVFVAGSCSRTAAITNGICSRASFPPLMKPVIFPVDFAPLGRNSPPTYSTMGWRRPSRNGKDVSWTSASRRYKAGCQGTRADQLSGSRQRPLRT